MKNLIKTKRFIFIGATLISLFYNVSCKKFESADKTVLKKEVKDSLDIKPSIVLSQDQRDNIIKIIENNDVLALKKLINSGVDVNAVFDGFFRGGREVEDTNLTNNDWTMLMVASFYNKVKIAQFLLQNGANINQQNKVGHTALFLACANRSEEMAKFLLKNNADATIESRDTDGLSTLHWAIDYEWNDVVGELLTKDVDVNSFSSASGNNILISALMNNGIKQDVIVKIIEKGADINYINPKDGNNALMWVCERNFVNVAMKLVSKGANVNILSKNGSTALSFAAANKSCDTKLIDFLVQNGAKINIDEKYGRSALVEAVSSNCLSKVDYLVKRGAEINEKSVGFGGVSPLTESLWQTNYPITKYLIDNGANVNIAKDNGETALLVAVWNEKNYENVDLLLKKGSDVNKTDVDLQSPLLKAVQYDHYDIAVLLIKNGADTKAVDTYGRSVKSTLDETVARTGNKQWLNLKL